MGMQVVIIAKRVPVAAQGVRIVADKGTDNRYSRSLIIADLISFGRLYMSNPDLPERFRDGVPLADPPEYPDWWTKEDGDGYVTFPKSRECKQEPPPGSGVRGQW